MNIINLKFPNQGVYKQSFEKRKLSVHKNINICDPYKIIGSLKSEKKDVFRLSPVINLNYKNIIPKYVATDNKLRNRRSYSLEDQIELAMTNKNEKLIFSKTKYL